MIKWMLREGARKFSRRYDYDTTYMEQIIDASASAGLRLSAAQFMSQYRGPNVARDIWAGALLASTLEGDCGPCGQLVLDMALEAAVPEHALQACIQGDPLNAGNTGLGFRFATAAIAGDIHADVLREEIERGFGRKALVAAAFAAASGRMYPVLKRSLGHGVACQKLSIGTADVTVEGF